MKLHCQQDGFDAGRLGLTGLGAVSREDIRLILLEHEIELRPLWKPMHMHPLYAGTVYHASGVDERLFAQVLCIPSRSDMSDDQQDEVIARILRLPESAN